MHSKDNEGHNTMTEQLRQNPQVLATMLQQRLTATKKEMSQAVVRNDVESISKLSSAIVQIEDAQAQLSLQGLTADAGPDPALATADPIEVAAEAPTSGSGEQGLGFSPPPGEEGPGETVTDNPVAMPANLRRQMGEAAADYLDDYALTVHERVMQFVEKLRDVALKLGAGDDPDDGITSLRESLKEEVGRRGLEAVEPVYDEWLQGLFGKITKTMKVMFTVPSAPIDLKDSEVGELLGLDDASDAMEEADDGEKAGLDTEEAEKEAVKTNASAPPATSLTEAVQAAGKAAEDAPLQMATGPISLRIEGTKPSAPPLSASVDSAPEQTKARDFVPSRSGTARLE